jgi:hypothetical protein
MHVFDCMQIEMKSTFQMFLSQKIIELIIHVYTVRAKDFRATLVRRLTAATAAITLAFLFVEMLCYVLGRLHSNCVLSTKIGLHR